MFVIAVNVAERGGDEHQWRRHVDKNHGRYRFQMDLGLSLMNAGISHDWKDPKANNKVSDRPLYVRKHDWIPCDCKRCFFCLNKMTCGVTHPNRGVKKQPKSYERPACTPRMNLGGSSRYCEICVSEKTSVNPKKTLTEVRKMCKQTTMGCKTCLAYVCKQHWGKHGTQK